MERKISKCGRRTILTAFSGLTGLGIIGTASATADPTKRVAPPEETVDMNFAPGNKWQLREFLLAFAEIKDEAVQDDIWEMLNRPQRKAVGEAVQPHSFESEVRERKSTTDSVTVATTRKESYEHVVTAVGSWGVTAFEFHHEITWLYDFDAIEIKDPDNSGWVENTFYGWDDSGPVTNDIDKKWSSDLERYTSFEARQVRRMDYASGVWGLTSYYPESTLSGDASGWGSVVSDYDGGV